MRALPIARWLRRGTCLWVAVLLFAGSASAQLEVAIDPTPVLDIAGTSADGDVLFGQVVGATRLSSGTIVVADAASGAVKFFGANGTSIRAVGRLGRGPGEFRRLAWLGQCGVDSILVWDLTLRRFTLVDSAANVVGQYQVPSDSQPSTPVPAYIACSRGGLLAYLGRPLNIGLEPSASQFERVRAPLVIGRVTTAIWRTLTNVSVAEIAFAHGSWYPRPLGRTTQVAVTSGTLIIGQADSGAVDVLALDGSRLTTILMPSPNRRPTRTHVERSVDQLTASLTGAIRDGFRKTLLELPWPEWLPPYSAVLSDVRSNVWIVSSIPGDGLTSLRGFTLTGEPIGVLEVPAETTVFEIGADYLLGMYEDDGAEPHIVLYRLRPSFR